MELTALLSVAVAKADGDMSSEEKQHLLHSFETVFQLSARDASDLLQSSSHLYGDGSAVRDKVEDVVQSCVGKFSEAQVGSALELLRAVADVGGAQTHAQSELLRRIESKLAQKSADGESWG